MSEPRRQQPPHRHPHRRVTPNCPTFGKPAAPIAGARHQSPGTGSSSHNPPRLRHGHVVPEPRVPHVGTAGRPQISRCAGRRHSAKRSQMSERRHQKPPHRHPHRRVAPNPPTFGKPAAPIAGARHQLTGTGSNSHNPPRLRHGHVVPEPRAPHVGTPGRPQTSPPRADGTRADRSQMSEPRHQMPPHSRRHRRVAPNAPTFGQRAAPTASAVRPGPGSNSLSPRLARQGLVVPEPRAPHVRETGRLRPLRPWSHRVRNT